MVRAFDLTAVTLIGVLAAQSQAWPVTISEIKSQFVADFTSACLEKQRGAAENAKLADRVIVQYCDCVARHGEEVLEIEDMLASTKGPIPRRMQMQLNALGETCAEVVAGKTKDGPANPRGKPGS
jgi:hypothetical protein